MKIYENTCTNVSQKQTLSPQERLNQMLKKFNKIGFSYDEEAADYINDQLSQYNYKAEVVKDDTIKVVSKEDGASHLLRYDIISDDYVIVEDSLFPAVNINSNYTNNQQDKSNNQVNEDVYRRSTRLSVLNNKRRTPNTFNDTTSANEELIKKIKVNDENLSKTKTSRNSEGIDTRNIKFSEERHNFLIKIREDSPNLTLKEASEMFFEKFKTTISVPTVLRLWNSKGLNTSKVQFSEEHRNFLIQIREDSPNLTLKEASEMFFEKFKTTISVQTVLRLWSSKGINTSNLKFSEEHRNFLIKLKKDDEGLALYKASEMFFEKFKTTISASTITNIWRDDGIDTRNIKFSKE